MPVTASLTRDIVNPIVEATFDTFELMMDAKCQKTGLALLTPDIGFHPITAVIGLTGRVAGSLCLSFPVATALETVYRMVDMRVEEINGLVCDTVGEFANVIAGSAKDRVTHLNLELGIPNIIRGENHHVEFPSSCQPLCADFNSDVGPFRIAFGFVEKGV